MLHVKPYVRRRSRVRNPALIINRWSGDGKAEAVGLEEQARSLGIKVVMLERGDDLSQLAHDAISTGADAIGMAGGDGSLGLVAAVAAECDVPFFCIPVGTRNHFALDLGLDRDDPVAALEALGDGDELLIDFGLVGGRVFLNNVSLGVYATAVHQEGYRAEKVKTIAQVLAETAADPELQHSLRFATPDGRRYDRAPLVLVSNNRYVMTGPPDFGRRSRMDGGVLGVGAVTRLPEAGSVSSVTLGDLRGLHEWETSSLRIESDDETILAGVDGEALEFPAPLDITISTRRLRVLVPAGVRPGYLPPGEAIAARLLDLAEIGGHLDGPGDG
jgi:diacylglycerol kinase family enzyme